MATRLRLNANSVASMVAIAASQQVPQRVAALLAVMPQEHERAAGAWQAELAEWPQRVMSAHGAARAMAQALPALQVNPQRMRSNIDAVATSLPKAVAAEWFNANLVQHAARITELQLVALKSQTP